MKGQIFDEVDNTVKLDYKVLLTVLVRVKRKGGRECEMSYLREEKEILRATTASESRDSPLPEFEK